MLFILTNENSITINDTFIFLNPSIIMALIDTKRLIYEKCEVYNRINDRLNTARSNNANKLPLKDFIADVLFSINSYWYNMAEHDISISMTENDIQAMLHIIQTTSSSIMVGDGFIYLNPNIDDPFEDFDDNVNIIYNPIPFNERKRNVIKNLINVKRNIYIESGIYQRLINRINCARSNGAESLISNEFIIDFLLAIHSYWFDTDKINISKSMIADDIVSMLHMYQVESKEILVKDNYIFLNSFTDDDYNYFDDSINV